MSNEDKGVNRDPITGTPGAHPIGTGLGAAAGAGALAGKGIAGKTDPTIEEAYWRENYVNRTYVTSGSTFDDYGPAYVYGIENHSKHPGRKFDDVEARLGQEWQRAKGKSSLTWEKAKHAARDAWQRVSDTLERATPGDSDHDGK